MKIKFGFTLAEVLITLAIIGVVAAITIPSLMNSFKEQAIKSKLKEGFSIISRATNQMAFDNGGNLIGTFSTGVDLKNNYTKYLSVSKSCDSGNGKCWPSSVFYKNGTNSWASESDVPSIILNNGFAIGFTHVGTEYFNTSCTGKAGFLTNSVCYVVYLDINGLKGSKIWGTDIFAFWVLQDGKVIPVGTSQDAYSSSNCKLLTTWGGECTAYYLQQ